MATTEYQVSGMSCAHCETAIAEEVGRLAGVDRVEADATTGKLVVTAISRIDDALVLAAVDEAGYEAVRV